MVDVFIGIGSSLNKLENINAGIRALEREFGELTVSALYESEAVGFSGANFYNLVVGFKTDLTTEVLIAKLKTIEILHGKVENALKFSPRTLDLDLLLYDLLVDESINLPRGEITKNAFVLQPLAELAGQLIHPVLQETYQALWANYPKEKQKLWKIKHTR